MSCSVLVFVIASSNIIELSDVNSIVELDANLYTFTEQNETQKYTWTVVETIPNILSDELSSDDTICYFEVTNKTSRYLDRTNKWPFFVFTSTIF